MTSSRARMLGRIAIGSPCSCCNDTIDQRKTKRRENRAFEREIRVELSVVRDEPAHGDDRGPEE